METLQSVKSFIMGNGFIPQILLVLLILIVMSTIMTIIDVSVNAVKRFDRQSAVLIENTYTRGTVIPQNGDDPQYPLLYPSTNERHGLEFSYSFYLFIDPESFNQTVTGQCGSSSTQNTVGLRHILHKGSRDIYPSMSPGIFLHADKNTIRVIMNSEANPLSANVDIPNIPVGKWFHFVVTMKGQFMDVYMNGNIVSRRELPTVPKINYGAVYVMSDRIFPEPGSNSDTTNLQGMRFEGPIKGMISRVKYYAFALNYSQIDQLYREEPSKRIESPSFSQTPPYFRDDWWVTRY